MDKNKPAEQRKETRDKVIRQQKGRLTKEQMTELENALNRYLGDFLEGYVLVGFVAGAKNEPIYLNVHDDAKTGLALQHFMEDLEIIPDQDDDDDDDDDDRASENWKKS